MWLPIGEVHDGGRRFNFACIEGGIPTNSCSQFRRYKRGGDFD
jgi:hypothetical protein